MADGSPRRRLRACVEAWPECAEGLFDPNCCRFPKSCSCDVYDPEQVTDADLEEPQHPSQSDRRSGGAPHSSQVERALSLLVNASRVSPPLREALFTVEAHITGLSDDLRWYRDAFQNHVDEIDRLRGLMAEVVDEHATHPPIADPVERFMVVFNLMPPITPRSQP